MNCARAIETRQRSVDHDPKQRSVDYDPNIPIEEKTSPDHESNTNEEKISPDHKRGEDIFRSIEDSG